MLREKFTTQRFSIQICTTETKPNTQRCTQVSNVKSQASLKSLGASFIQLKSQVIYVKAHVKSQVATHIKLFAASGAFIHELWRKCA